MPTFFWRDAAVSPAARHFASQPAAGGF